MAVVPSLAAMAALTLFQNPHMQPEGYSVDYSAYSAPATVIQRRQRRRIGAVTRIAAAIRGWKARMDQLFTYPFNTAPYAVQDLYLGRRRNMLFARCKYRSTSRNRTFGNTPLSMQ